MELLVNEHVNISITTQMLKLNITYIRVIGLSTWKGAVQIVRFPCQVFVHVDRPGETVELVGGHSRLKYKKMMIST